MFVQCLPSPHTNNMDHLQRRNSQSGSYNTKISDSNAAGSAKKVNDWFHTMILKSVGEISGKIIPSYIRTVIF